MSCTASANVCTATLATTSAAFAGVLFGRLGSNSRNGSSDAGPSAMRSSPATDRRDLVIATGLAGVGMRGASGGVSRRIPVLWPTSRKISSDDLSLNGFPVDSDTAACVNAGVLRRGIAIPARAACSSTSRPTSVNSGIKSDTSASARIPSSIRPSCCMRVAYSRKFRVASPRSPFLAQIRPNVKYTLARPGALRRILLQSAMALLKSPAVA